MGINADIQKHGYQTCVYSFLISSLITTDLILITAKNLVIKHRAFWLVSTWSNMTYAGATTLGFGCRFCAHPFGLLMIQLKMFKALGQGQLLLNRHAKQGVEGLLFIFSCSKLALHFIQLSDIFITPAVKVHF